MGGSGSGSTTLGAALAARLGSTHFDVDDAFWMPTDPPFTTKRPSDERDAMIRAQLEAKRDWIVSGSVVGWSWPRPDRDIDLVVFLFLPAELRMARIRAREVAKYGAETLGPGGVMHANSVAFLAWAERYDTAGLEQRSRATHEAWLAACTSPVLRI